MEWKLEQISYSLNSDASNAREAVKDSMAKIRAAIDAHHELAAVTAAYHPLTDVVLLQSEMRDSQRMARQVNNTLAKIGEKVEAANAEALAVNQLLKELNDGRASLMDYSRKFKEAADRCHQRLRFTRFSALPTEICVMIWEQALSTVSVWGGLDGFLRPGKAALSVQGPGHPSHEVGLSCREARSTLERLYVKVLRKRCRKHGPWDESSWDKSTGYWINPRASIFVVPAPERPHHRSRMSRWKNPPTGSRVLQMYPRIQNAVIYDSCSWYSGELETYGEVLLSRLSELRRVFIFDNAFSDGWGPDGRLTYLQREGVRDYLSELMARAPVSEGPIHDVDDWTSALKPHNYIRYTRSVEPGRCATAAAIFRDALLQHPSNDAGSAPERQLTVHFIFPCSREHAAFTVKLHKKE